MTEQEFREYNSPEDFGCLCSIANEYGIGVFPYRSEFVGDGEETERYLENYISRELRSYMTLGELRDFLYNCPEYFDDSCFYAVRSDTDEYTPPEEVTDILDDAYEELINYLKECEYISEPEEVLEEVIIVSQEELITESDVESLYS